MDLAPFNIQATKCTISYSAITHYLHFNSHNITFHHISILLIGSDSVRFVRILARCGRYWCRQTCPSYGLEVRKKRYALSDIWLFLAFFRKKKKTIKSWFELLQFQYSNVHKFGVWGWGVIVLLFSLFNDCVGISRDIKVEFFLPFLVFLKILSGVTVYVMLDRKYQLKYELI